MTTDEPPSTFANALSRYGKGYKLGGRIVLVSMVLLAVSALPLLYFLIVFFSGLITGLGAGASLGGMLQAFFTGIIFLFYGLIFLLASFLFRACAYMLVGILDLAVNSSADLTEEQKRELKTIFGP